jgi:hypothetical protein
MLIWFLSCSMAAPFFPAALDAGTGQSDAGEHPQQVALQSLSQRDMAAAYDFPAISPIGDRTTRTCSGAFHEAARTADSDSCVIPEGEGL